MTTLQSLLIFLPYAYTVLTTVAVYIAYLIRKTKLNLLNYFKGYVYYVPTWIFAILTLCLVPYEETDALTPIVFAFFLPVLFSFLLLWGLYDISKEESAKQPEQLDLSVSERIEQLERVVLEKTEESSDNPLDAEDEQTGNYI
jgi:hypothetical protein